MAEAPRGVGGGGADPERRHIPLAILQLDYQVTQDLVKMLTDIRFRLLNILPPISAASVTLISAQTFSGLSPLAMSAVGLMGFCLTLGLVLYDQRNSDLYNACIHRAKILEGVLGFVRRGDEILKSSPSADAKAMAHAIASQLRSAQEDAEAPEAVAWAGGPHRQRAVSYLRFLGTRVSHGSALALVYGVLLGAWLFPIAKGTLVLAGNALLALEVMNRVSDRTGLATSAPALVLAVAGACAFRRSLEAAGVAGAEDGLYKEAVPKGDKAQREKEWRDGAKCHAAGLVAAKMAKSLIVSLLLSTDPGKGVLSRLLDWWRQPKKTVPSDRTQAETATATSSEEAGRGGRTV